MSTLRRVWDFIVQPTEPIQLWPQTRAPGGPIVAAASGAAPAAAAGVGAAAPSSLSAGASALRASASALAGHNDHHSHGGDGNGLWEAAGLIGAIVAFQSIQYALDRWYRPGPPAWQPNEARIRELVQTLQLQPHPEGGFYRRIYASPWTLGDASCIQREEGAADSSSAAAASVDHTAAASSSAAVAAAAPSTPSPHSPPLPMHFPRPVGSSIYFLLSASAPTSHLHRLPCDELWTWIEGDPLVIAQVDVRTGQYSERILGPVRLEPPGVAHGAGRHVLVRPSSTAPQADSAEMAALASPVDSLQLAAGTARPPPPRCTLAFPTHVVPGGTWFGARLDARPNNNAAAAPSSSSSSSSPSSIRHGYSLVCCVVTPAFQFEDFEMMSLDEFNRMRVAEQLRSTLATSELDEGEREAQLRAVTEMVLRTDADRQQEERNRTAKEAAST